MIVACVALTVALGGTGVAAVNAVLPRNSVGTLQLKNSAVTSVKVKNFSLTRADFARGTLIPGAQGPQGPPGSNGQQGVKGEKGDKGDKGGLGDVAQQTASVSVPDATANDGLFESRSLQVNCGADEKGITGGTNWDGESDSAHLFTVLSTPVYDAANKRISGWRARGANDSGAAKAFQVFVECVKA